MIKRLSKHNDLKDLIKSCPSGVIDDIYAIEYYIQGYNTIIQASFTKKETMLEVIIPSTDLETLPNGILMRRAFYKVLDASYPDGYYNLEFEDNMNVWIGENESEEPVIPEYVTEEELSSTLSSYATQSWVYGRGYATESFVSGQIGSVKNWVVSQSFLTSASLSNYITESTIESLGFATESWVQGQGYLTSVPSEYATQSWVSSQQFVTQSWVQSQGYLTSVPSEYATQSWVQGQGYITIGEIPSGLATQSWVQSQGYITSTDLSGYATESWVQQQGYLTGSSTLPADQITLGLPDIPQNVEGAITQLAGYIDTITTEDIPDLDSRVTALEQSSGSSAWGNITGTITNQTDLMTLLGGYATQSWATDQFLEESKVWCGTAAQWNNLTEEEKASYKIALVTA